MVKKEMRKVFDILLDLIGFLLVGFLVFGFVIFPHMIMIYAVFRDVSDTEWGDITSSSIYLVIINIGVGGWFWGANELVISPFPCLFDIYIVFTFIEVLTIMLWINNYTVKHFKNIRNIALFK